MTRVRQQPRRQLRWKRQCPPKRLVEMVRKLLRGLVRNRRAGLRLESSTARRTRVDGVGNRRMLANSSTRAEDGGFAATGNRQREPPTVSGKATSGVSGEHFWF